MSHQRLKEDVEQQPSRKGSAHCLVSFVNETCIQIIAWMLLTVGLCIIVGSCYLSMRQSTDDPIIVNDKANNSNNSNYYVAINNGSQIDNADDQVDVAFDIKEPDVSYGFVKSRALENYTFINSSTLRCQEVSCAIVCINNTANKLYTDVATVMNESSCGLSTTLILEDQTRTFLQRNWIALNRTVHKISIASSKISKIKSGVFNAPMFAKVFEMFWYNLTVEKVDSGALLGLYSLEILKINTKLPKLDIAFLQPVQTTLKHLRLNADLTFHKNSSIFRALTCFDKLEFLDLSFNRFEGALNKHIFRKTPNLKYLSMEYAAISVIEADTFKMLAGKLHFLNLAHNRLTTLSGDVLLPLLSTHDKTFIDLESNPWQCDCKLRHFAAMYTAHRGAFINALYCRYPYDLYGIELNALPVKTFECALSAKEPTSHQSILTTTIDWSRELIDTGNRSREDDELYSSEKIPVGAVIQLNCSFKTQDQAEYEHLEVETPRSAAQYFVFEQPTYDLVLTLEKNLSVKAEIAKYESSSNLNIIWFSEKYENDVVSRESAIVDYNCLSYASPFVMTSELDENTTYTFCMMPQNDEMISPLNCQPFHVPATRTTNNNDEINTKLRKEKQFTIGMLCLIFLSSAFFGGVIAYLGIKTYPDLLEGSKNVLVVKKPERTCYVSTITETEYMKKKLFGDSIKREISKPLPETPKLDRLASIKSSSTLFEESFPNVVFREDEYEMPKTFNEQNFSTKRYVANNSAMSPGSPPPLPKRNSNQSSYSGSLKSNKYGQ